MSLSSSCIYVGVIEVRDLDEEMAVFLPLSFADPHPLVLLPFSLFCQFSLYTYDQSITLLCIGSSPAKSEQGNWPTLAVFSGSRVLLSNVIYSVWLDAHSWGDGTDVHLNGLLTHLFRFNKVSVRLGFWGTKCGITVQFCITGLKDTWTFGYPLPMSCPPPSV